MDEVMQNNSELLNGYRLSDTERRILEVALNPTFTTKSLQAKCSAANVAKNTWYRAMGNPEFIKLLNKLSLDMLKGKINDVINATYKYALSSPKNAQDRKMVLTMAGVYSEKQEIKAEVNGDLNNKIDFSNLSTDEIKELLNK